MKTCSSYSHHFSLFQQIFRKVCSRGKNRRQTIRRQTGSLWGLPFRLKRQVRGRRGMRKIFIKRKKCNMLPLFPLIHIQHSTFHQADRCGSLQTIRWFRQSDFRRSTQACFPLLTHRGINFPPAAGWSPFLSRKELRSAISP